MLSSAHKEKPYLQDYSYYDELYDRHTIEECKWLLGVFEKVDPKAILNEEKLTDEQIAFKWNFLIGIHLNCLRGERAVKKAESIQEWMNRDERRDKKLADAQPPTKLLCMHCGIYMQCHYINLKISFDDKEPERIEFSMHCPECKDTRQIFDDGIENMDVYDRCPKCKTKMESLAAQKIKKKIIDAYKCPKCKEQKEFVIDLSKKKETKDEQNEEKMIRQFRIDRARFCLSEKDMLEYKSNMERIKFVVDDWKQREGKQELYNEIKKLEKLTIAGLEKFLIPELGRQKYAHLKLLQPQVDRGVTIEFSVQDTDPDRGEYVSRTVLKKLLDKTLLKTNWSLMKTGVDYRLGILTGRFKGHEGEEALLELVEMRKKKKDRKVAAQS